MAAPYVVAGCALPPPPAATARASPRSGSTGATRVTSNGQPLLLLDSQAICAPTGTPLLIVVDPDPGDGEREETAMNIDFPFHFDDRGRTAHDRRRRSHPRHDRAAALHHPGERVNRPDFGSGLLQLVFAPNSPELAAALQFTVQAALQRWLGDLIDVQTLEVDERRRDAARRRQYVVRRTGERAHRYFRNGAAHEHA